jgi:hypothetical protein
MHVKAPIISKECDQDQESGLLDLGVPPGCQVVKYVQLRHGREVRARPHIF